jgi:ElaB/YqjD/DUF883 family membrane-anchored ribosome-binding protein
LNSEINEMMVEKEKLYQEAKKQINQMKDIKIKQETEIQQLKSQLKEQKTKYSISFSQ